MPPKQKSARNGGGGKQPPRKDARTHRDRPTQVFLLLRRRGLGLRPIVALAVALGSLQSPLTSRASLAPPR